MNIINKSLEAVIIQYRQTEDKKRSDKSLQLANLFYELTKNVIGYYNFDFINEDDALQEGVMICFQKLERWKSELNGKAFNYFTTCVACHLRQLYRTRKHIKEFYGQ